MFLQYLYLPLISWHQNKLKCSKSFIHFNKQISPHLLALLFSCFTNFVKQMFCSVMFVIVDHMFFRDFRIYLYTIEELWSFSGLKFLDICRWESHDLSFLLHSSDLFLIYSSSLNQAKFAQNPQSTEELQPPSQASNEIQPSHQNPLVAETPGPNPCSSSITNNQNRNVSREDIELVQNLIERCLQLYMNRGEVVRTLSERARIEPGFTTLVWKKLEEENPDFFRAYYIRLKLKKQIILFNHLLEHQCQLMKCPVLPNVPLAPIHSGIHAGPVNSMPLGYPVLQQPAMMTTGQPHFDPVSCGLSSCDVVNGIPAPGRYHPIHINSGNDIVINDHKPEATPATAPCGAISSLSEMAASPASVASNNHFPFTPSEISGMGLDASTLETTLTSDVASMGELQLSQDCAIGSSRDSLGSLGPLWNFSITDLTTDLANLGDLGALENYTSSPFLPSDSDIRLDSSEHDDTIEEYFAEAITAPSSQPDEQKS